MEKEERKYRGHFFWSAEFEKNVQTVWFVLMVGFSHILYVFLTIQSSFSIALLWVKSSLLKVRVPCGLLCMESIWRLTIWSLICFTVCVVSFLTSLSSRRLVTFFLLTNYNQLLPSIIVNEALLADCFTNVVEIWLSQSIALDVQSWKSDSIYSKTCVVSNIEYRKRPLTVVFQWREIQCFEGSHQECSALS